jgi:hypothetical protein
MISKARLELCDLMGACCIFGTVFNDDDMAASVAAFIILSSLNEATSSVYQLKIN